MVLESERIFERETEIWNLIAAVEYGIRSILLIPIYTWEKIGNSIKNN